MTDKTQLTCTCGATRIEVAGEPILAAECCCASCSEAARRFERLPGARPIRGAQGQTSYVLYRKDRVRFLSGTGQMQAFRLKPDSATRRVVAGCCNTPLFTEFKGGHWLSLYGGLWPAAARPPLEMRTMTSDLPDPSVLPTDVPNLKSQSGGFFVKLLWAWIAMGFRVPRIEVAGTLDA